MFGLSDLQRMKDGADGSGMNKRKSTLDPCDHGSSVAKKDLK